MTCIPTENVHDGYPNCANGEDELEPAKVVEVKSTIYASNKMYKTLKFMLRLHLLKCVLILAEPSNMDYSRPTADEIYEKFDILDEKYECK